VNRSRARLFELHRDEDESGVSGAGVVAEGVEFTSGIVILTWFSPHRSVEFNESMRTVEELHGHGGKTRVVWVAPPVPVRKRPRKRLDTPPRTG
jgi:hypothetical protein